MDTELRVALTKHFLAKEGRVYHRGDGTILAEVEKHRPHITKSVNDVMRVINKVTG